VAGPGGGVVDLGHRADHALGRSRVSGLKPEGPVAESEEFRVRGHPARQAHRLRLLRRSRVTLNWFARHAFEHDVAGAGLAEDPKIQFADERGLQVSDAEVADQVAVEFGEQVGGRLVGKGVAEIAGSHFTDPLAVLVLVIDHRGHDHLRHD
jgi:hypothetical protein